MNKSIGRFSALMSGIAAAPKPGSFTELVEKAARGEMRMGHKYEMRIPMGVDENGKPKYKYIYAKQPHWRGKFIHEMLEEGSSVRLPEPDGVVHIVGEDEKGNIRLKKESTGEEITVDKEELSGRLKAMHAEKISHTLSMREKELKAVVKYGTLKQRQIVFAEASSFGLAIPPGYHLDGTEKAEAEDEAADPKELMNHAITLHEKDVPEVDVTLVPPHVSTFINPDEERGIRGLFQHQLEGVARIISSWLKRDGFLLQDDAGLGKTLTCLAAILTNAGRRNLIVVPTRGKDNLKNEVWKRDGQVLGLDIKDVSESFDPADENNARQNHDGNYICSYDELYDKKVTIDPDTGEEIETFELRPEFASGNWDTITFDECHNMANAASLRTQAAMLVQENAKKVLYCSATPFTNISDMHYLRRLSGNKLKNDPGWFSTGAEFVKWAVKAGARTAKTLTPVGDVPQKIVNPNTPKPLVVAAALMHVGGSSIKRVPQLSKSLDSRFHRTETVSLADDHQTAFKTADKIFDIAKEAGVEARRIGASKALWNRQMWEISKLDETVAMAEKSLKENPNGQVAIFTAHVKHDHNVLYGLEGAIRKRVEDGHLSAEKAEAHIAELKRHADSLPKVDVHQELLNRLGGHDKVAMIHGRSDELGAKTHDVGKGATWESVAKKNKMTVAELRNLNRGVDINSAKSLKVAKAPTSIEAQKAYQTGQKRIVIGSMAKAGTGLSFHDVVGNSQRHQINMSLPYSGVEFQQVFGRSHRLGSKSNTTMTWVRGDSETENRVSSIVSTKLQSMGALSTGDPGKLVSKELLMNYDHSSSTNPNHFADLLGANQDPALERAREHAKDTWDWSTERIKAGGDPQAEMGQLITSDLDRGKEQQSRRAVGQLIHSGFHVRVTDDNKFAISGMPPGSTGHNYFTGAKRSAKYDNSSGEWTVSNLDSFRGVARRTGAHKKEGTTTPEAMTNEHLDAIHGSEKAKKMRQRLANKTGTRIGDTVPDKSADTRVKRTKKSRFGDLVEKAVGSKKEAISKKIKLLMEEGYPQKQAVAIALQMGRDGKLASFTELVDTYKGRVYPPGTKRVRKTGVWVKQVDNSWTKVKDDSKTPAPPAPAPARREKPEEIEEVKNKKPRKGDEKKFKLNKPTVLGLSDFADFKKLAAALAGMLAKRLKSKEALVCVYNKHTKHKIEELSLGENYALVFVSKITHMYDDADKYLVVIKDKETDAVLADNQGADGKIRVLAGEGK